MSSALVVRIAVPVTAWVCSTWILTACSAEPQGRPVLSRLQAGPTDDGLVVADRAYLVEGEPGVAVEVTDDALVFDDAGLRPEGDWRPGDLVVNGEGAGFLRRVVDVQESDDGVVVRTELAELSEVVADGGIHATLRPFAEGQQLDDDAMLGGLQGRAAAFEPIGGLHDAPRGRAKELDLPGLNVELPPTTLVRSGGLDLTLTGGHFRFDPTLDLDLDLGWWTIERFEVLATGMMDAEIELRLGTDGNYEIVDRSMRLWESPRYAWTGFVGPVPVVVVSKLELDANVSVRTEGPSSVTVGAGAGSVIEVGAIYEDGWTMVGDHQFEARIHGPEFVLDTELHARVGLEGTLSVELYDVVGPRLTVAPWASLEVDDTQRWWADLGVDGRIGGAISLPWRDDLSLDGELFAWSQRLAEGQL